MERLRRDASRLLQMLASTSEWAEFAQLAEDSEGVTHIVNTAAEPAKVCGLSSVENSWRL